MNTSLLFGRQELRLDLPENLQIHEINKYPMPLLEDVDGSIRGGPARTDRQPPPAPTGQRQKIGLYPDL